MHHSAPNAVTAPRTTRRALAASRSSSPRPLGPIVKAANRIKVDDTDFDVDPGVTIEDVVSDDVQQIVKEDGEVVERSRFRKTAADQSFKTNLKSIEKGGGRTRIDLLRQDLIRIQRFMDGFESMPSGYHRSASLEADGRLVVVRNFPLPNGYQPDYVDVMLDVSNYPARPPIGMHLLERKNAMILQRIVDRFGGHVFTNGFHGARSFSGFRWICMHYADHTWSFNANDVGKGDNLSKFLELFFAKL